MKLSLYDGDMSGNHFSKSKGHNSVKIICTKEDPDFNVVMIYLLHLSIEYMYLYSSRDNLQKLTLHVPATLWWGHKVWFLSR